MSRETELGRMVHFAENGDSASARASRMIQDRRPTTMQSSGSWVDWGAGADILGQPFDTTRIPISKLEQMRRDPMLAFGLMFCKVPLIRAPWYIRCSDPRISKAVDAALRRVYGRFILAWTNSFDFGYAGLVKRFELDMPDWTYLDKSDPDGRDKPVWPDKTVSMVVWKPFTALNPRTAIPHWNSRGEFAGIDFNPAGPQSMSAFFNSGQAIFPSQQGGKPRVADIPLDWALWATNEKDSVFGSYWGYPRIGYAYRYWWAYWYRFGLTDRAFERWADPPIVAFHPAEIGVDEDGNRVDFGTEALTVAEKLRSGANVSMPSSVVKGFDERQTNVREWEVEQMETKAQFEALNQAFEYLDIQKLRSVMVPEQALVEGRGGTSSRNVAATFGDIFQESQAVVKEEIDDHLNRFVIPQFVEANFGANAPKAEIVTTGFDPQDIDTMRAVVQAVSNKDGARLPIDMDELLERLGIPRLSPAQFDAQLEREAEQAKKFAPPPVPAESGPNEVAGVTKQGLYYGARERIVLSGGPQPYAIQVVDELPPESHNPAAYFDADTRTLKVLDGSTSEQIQNYVFGLAERAEGQTTLPEADEVHQLLAAMGEKVTELAEREPEIHVHIPPAEERRRGRVERIPVRDEEGNIIKVVEREVDDE